MRINQLREYLDALIVSGVDPNTPVCIHDADPAEYPMEVCDAKVLTGPFGEDPAPKMCGFLSSNGTFLLLQTVIDYEPMLNARPPLYSEVENVADAPEKSWPNGHWFNEPRRKPGQP